MSLHQTRVKGTAVLAVLIMAAAALGAVAIAGTDDSDAASTVTLESGRSKHFTWSELGVSYAALTAYGDGEWSCTVEIPQVFLGPSNTSTYYRTHITTSNASSSGVTLACPDGAKPGTYTMTWVAVDSSMGMDEVGSTSIRITNDHTGWSVSYPLHSLDWSWNVPQNVGSFNTTLYIERGAPVVISSGSFGYAPTVSLTSGTGLTDSVNTTSHSHIVSGSITSDSTFKLVYGSYTWVVNLKVVNKAVTINVPDQSVRAGDPVSIDTGVPGVTVTGQDWLHVSADGRIYGTAPSVAGTYKATAHYGGQSDEFTIRVVSKLVFDTVPTVGAIAYEG